MTPFQFLGNVPGAMDRLRAGGKLYVIEERPYPAPHRVVVLQDDEPYPISYNDFVEMVYNHLIQPIGATLYEGFSADAYVIAPSAGSNVA